ncbi:MAG: helix-turn-helix domain-containing protein [Candidatus Saccharimonadales bacterium]
MQPVIKWLHEYGLNQTEVKVYLCVLQNPAVKVSDIQRLTALVRTTLYYTLAELKTRGLISENLQNNVKSYRAADPDVLKNDIEAQIATNKKQLNELENLETIFNSLAEKKVAPESYVARFEGIAPIKGAIEQAFRCHSKRWHIIAARKNFLYFMSKQYQQYYLAERRRRGITAKTLWEPTEDFREPTLEDVLYRNQRRLPENFRGRFKSLVIIYDDTTLIIDPYEYKTAHAIHNATTARLLSMLHESIWHHAGKNRA